jgi:putative heme iron utilization protein
LWRNEGTIEVIMSDSGEGQDAGQDISPARLDDKNASLPPAMHARQLLRAARVGTLATSAAGQPYAALVTPATAPDGTPLILISSMSEHTRQLQADPRCALLVAGPAPEANPQTTPRVTLTCRAEPADQIDLPALKARYLTIHPYAALYAEFGDFSLWRLRPLRGAYVGGFARAARLSAEDLLAAPDAVAALGAAEHSILQHCNDHHPDALAAIALAAGGTAGEWRMVTADVDGCDLVRVDATEPESALRIHWPNPVADAGGVRSELVRLARAAREASPSS